MTTYIIFKYIKLNVMWLVDIFYWHILLNNIILFVSLLYTKNTELKYSKLKLANQTQFTWIENVCTQYFVIIWLKNTDELNKYGLFNWNIDNNVYTYYLEFCSSMTWWFSGLRLETAGSRVPVCWYLHWVRYFIRWTKCTYSPAAMRALE